LERTPRPGVEVHHLGARVDTGIGAPGAGDPHPMAGERGQRGLERILDRPPRRLGLPAVESGAIVGKGQGDALHAARSETKTKTGKPGFPAQRSLAGPNLSLKASIVLSVVVPGRRREPLPRAARGRPPCRRSLRRRTPGRAWSPSPATGWRRRPPPDPKGARGTGRARSKRGRPPWLRHRRDRAASRATGCRH